MHGSVGLHSALAIKRQRQVREQKRRKERSFSSPRGSAGTLADKQLQQRRYSKHYGSGSNGTEHESGIGTNIGMMHLGVVFLVIGSILLGSGLLPDNLNRTLNSGRWINELISSGIFSIVIGLFLLIVNRFLSDKEDEQLHEYVQSQLTRTKSGHRLERDSHTGVMKSPITGQNYSRQSLKKSNVADTAVDHAIPHSPIIKSIEIAGEPEFVFDTKSHNFSHIVSDTRILLGD